MRRADDDRRRRFDLAAPPLLRATLIRRADRCEIVLTGHHLVLDGWSLPLLVRELLHAYADIELPPAPDHRLHRTWLDAQDEQTATEAWRTALGGVTEPTRLVPDDPGEQELPFEHTVLLDTELTERLAAFARERELTLSTLTQTVWGLVLSAHTGRRDVVFGTVVSGRPADVPGAADMIGLFVNTVPVRVTVRPEETLAALAHRVQDEFAGLLPHHHLGLAAVQRATGHGVLFDTLTALENYPADGVPALAESTGLGVAEIRGRDATHYPVTFAAVPGERLTLRLTYRLGRRHPVPRRGVRRARRAPAAGPRHRPGHARRRPGRADRRRTHRAHRPPRGPARTGRPHLGRPLRRAAGPQAGRDRRGRPRRHPDVRRTRPAGPRTGRRAARARNPRGAARRRGAAALGRPGGRPARRPAGGRGPPAHRPGLPRGPRRRDAPGRPPGGRAHPLGARRTLPRRTPHRRPGTPRAAAPRPAVTSDHPAYTIFTSGSTGRPKGVVTPHRGLAALATAQAERLAVDDDSRVLQLASPSFDASVMETLMALATGATLVVPEPGPLAGALLGETIARRRVTHALIPPTALTGLEPDGLDHLRTLIVGGEACTAPLAARWAPRPPHGQRLRPDRGHRLCHHERPSRPRRDPAHRHRAARRAHPRPGHPAPARTARRDRRAVRGRARRRPGIPRPPPAHRRTLHRRARRSARQPHVPHRRPGLPSAGRLPAPPRTCRRPGEDPGLPRRTR